MHSKVWKDACGSLKGMLNSDLFNRWFAPIQPLQLTTRFEQARALDPRIDSPAREGLTGTARADVYEPTREPEDVTVAPEA